jgi:uncharacterized membrane protein
MCPITSMAGMMRSIGVLAFIGVLDTAYLSWEYAFPSEPMVCGGGGGCDAVRASAYAYVHGVPLPLFGLVMYILILLSLRIAGERPGMRYAVLGLSGSGFLVSAYLTAVEVFVLRSVCLWCVTSAAVITAIFILSVLDIVGSARVVQ